MSEIRFEVDANAQSLAEAFARLAREQLPFATAVALTRVAQEARDRERGALSDTFTLRSRRRVEGGIQINRAEKKDWPRSRAEVGLRDAFMARHVTGGVKTPKPGVSHVAIPTRLVVRGPGGSVVSRLRPRPTRERPGAFVTDARGQHSSKTSPTGPALIRERVDAKLELQQKAQGLGKRRRVLSRIARLDVATWYLLREQVQIRARWPFPRGVRGTVGERYGVHFEREFRAAVQSARAQAGKMTTEAGRYFYLRARRALG